MKKKEFEEQLHRDIEEIQGALEEWVPSSNAAYAVVFEAMRYSLQAGGKRMRSVLVLEFCRAFGGDIRETLPFACAIEMIHTYSLIHDDLPCMDDDALRRGKPSCHIAFGEANAMLAGDALLTLAFSVMARAAAKYPHKAAAALKAIEVLAGCAGPDGMIGGQVMDLAAEQAEIDGETLRQIDLLKTSALLNAACQIGALLAGAPEAKLALVEQYAKKLGLAFQIVDDILDVTGDEQILGKPVGSDAKQKKNTYAGFYGIDGAKTMAEQLTDEALAVLKEIPNPDFLLELTRLLLDRRH